MNDNISSQGRPMVAPTFFNSALLTLHSREEHNVRKANLASLPLANVGPFPYLCTLHSSLCTFFTLCTSLCSALSMLFPSHQPPTKYTIAATAMARHKTLNTTHTTPKIFTFFASPTLFSVFSGVGLAFCVFSNFLKFCTSLLISRSFASYISSSLISPPCENPLCPLFIFPPHFT